MLPSDSAIDAEFIRRVAPRPDRPAAANPKKSARSSTTQTDAKSKRDELIDKLIGSEAFIEHWTNKWADLLQVNRKFLGDVGAKALRD